MQFKLAPTYLQSLGNATFRRAEASGSSPLTPRQWEHDWSASNANLHRAFVFALCTPIKSAPAQRMSRLTDRHCRNELTNASTRHSLRNTGIK